VPSHVRQAEIETLVIFSLRATKSFSVLPPRGSPARPLSDMQLEDSIESLRAALLEVSNNNSDESSRVLPPIFTDVLVLSRPSFNYILSLAAFYERSQRVRGWRELLHINDDVNDDTVLDQQQSTTASSSSSSSSLELTRKEQLTLLSRLLAVVSIVGGQRYDIFVSPAKVLCGQDVILTHDFIRAMVKSTTAPEDVMTEAVRNVLEEGDANLYRRGVRTRKAFTLMQAVCRGWLVRRRKNDVSETKCSLSDDSHGEDDGCNAGNNRSDASISSSATSCQQTLNVDERALLETCNSILSYKAKVEDDLRVIENRIKREKSKLIRMLNLGVVHESRMLAIPAGDVPRPRSALITNTRPTNGPNSTIDEAFEAKITNFAERQRIIKQKERRLDERELKLKQKVIELKEEEVELKHKEARIAKVGSRLKKQQNQLKEQQLQFEMLKVQPGTAAIPLETSRPCPLCTEKNIQLRELMTKVRQRTRLLKQREAAVIGYYRKLRKREFELIRREGMYHQSTSNIPNDSKQQPPPEEQPLRQIEKTNAVERSQSLKRHSIVPRLKQHITAKGNSRSPTKSSSLVTSGLNTNYAQQSITGADLVEGIQTIVEETPVDEREDDLDGEMEGGGTNFHTTLRKSSGKEYQVLNSTSQQEDTTTLPPDARKVPGSETHINKRHIFTFEKRVIQTLPSLVPRNDNVVDKDRAPSIERKSQHESDWISSFDLQVKSAFTRLEMLV